MEQILNQARYYVEQNLPIIPCKYKEKRPLKKAWASWAQTTDYDLNDWINQYKEFNIGLVMGSNSGIIGIDIDGNEQYEYFKEKLGVDSFETWQYKTSDGGMRLLYKIPEGMEIKSKAIRFEGEHQEIALLSNGKQSILPPSVHPNGHRYEWIEGKSPLDIKISEISDNILEFFINKKNKKKSNKSKKKESINSKPTTIYKSNDIYTNYIIHKFANKCYKFKQAIITQKKSGLHEELWYSWISVLTNCGQEGIAKIFSRISSKHNKRSEERIDTLISEGALPIRCSTFGCDSCDIMSCFNSINYNDEEEMTNSPASYLNTIGKFMPPSNEVYNDVLNQFRRIDNYTLDKRGRLISYPLGDNPSKIISNFVTIPIKQVIRTDGDNQESEVEVYGIMENGKLLPKVTSSMKDVMNSDFIPEKWGLGAYISPGFQNKEKLRVVTQQLAREIPTEICYTHLGFAKNQEGDMIYLHANGAIGTDDVNIDIDSNLKNYKLPSTVENKEDAVLYSLSFIDVAETSISIPLLGLTYLSPLVSLTEEIGRSPKFVVWMHGLTGSRKTSLALVTLNHFGNFTSNSPPATFKDTANAIEKKSFIAKDSLVVVDDYCPAVDGAQARSMKSISERVLRSYGDRIGRSRMNSNMGLNKTYRPRGMAIVTGEDLPIGTSTTARYLGLEINRDTVNLDKLTDLQKNHIKLSESMSLYIQWIIENKSYVIQLIEELFEEASIQYTTYEHHRIGEAVAWLYVGLNIFLTFVKEEISECCEHYGVILNEYDKAFRQLISNQIKLYQKQEIDKVFINTLEELINTNKVYLVDLNEKNNEVVYQGKFIGYKDEEFIYLHDATTYAEINLFLQKRNESLNMTIDSLLKNLKGKGMIKTETNQLKPKKLVPVDGDKKRLRLVHLYRKNINI